MREESGRLLRRGGEEVRKKHKMFQMWVRSLKLGSNGRFATTRSDFQVRKKESLGVDAWVSA